MPKDTGLPKWFTNWAKSNMPTVTGVGEAIGNINRGTEPVRYVIDALTRNVQQAVANDRNLIWRASSPTTAVTPPNPYDAVTRNVEGSRRNTRTSSGSQDVDFIRKLLLGLGIK